MGAFLGEFRSFVQQGFDGFAWQNSPLLHSFVVGRCQNCMSKSGKKISIMRHEMYMFWLDIAIRLEAIAAFAWRPSLEEAQARLDSPGSVEGHC